ncbi:MAG: hypothetical protein IIZ92_00610, partial [Aquincola sp.]|nr:hypothetical protein [Aquincola sp.]
GTNVSALRKLGDIEIPNGDSIEMVHLIAVMDIANYQSRNDPAVATLNCCSATNAAIMRAASASSSTIRAWLIRRLLRYCLEK